MKNRPYTKFIVSRPKDKSLQAYKAWMTEIAKRLTADSPAIKWTEAEWLANWKKFWQDKPQA